MADEQYLAAIKEFRVPEVLEKYLPTGFHGFDRDGCPVKIDALGQIDFSGILLSVSAEDVVRTKARQGIRALELCMEQSTISGKTVASNTVIYDLDGAGLRHLYRPGLRMMGQVANMYDHRFPGLTKQVIVLNAPRIFPVIYSIVSPLISKEMRERVKIFGSNWQDDLQKLISPEQLPKHYGGTCERHRGPKCDDVICYGGIVPETYYSLRNVDKSSFLSATVKPGAVFEVNVDVSAVNTILKWQFLTEDYDIKFSLTYKPNESSDSPETIIPSKKASSHVLLEEGECVCTKAGIYTLVFDNYYSWLHTKHLHYLVKLESSSVPSEGGSIDNPLTHSGSVNQLDSRRRESAQLPLYGLEVSRMYNQIDCSKKALEGKHLNNFGFQDGFSVKVACVTAHQKRVRLTLEFPSWNARRFVDGI